MDSSQKADAARQELHHCGNSFVALQRLTEHNMCTWHLCVHGGLAFHQWLQLLQERPVEACIAMVIKPKQSRLLVVRTTCMGFPGLSCYVSEKL